MSYKYFIIPLLILWFIVAWHTTRPPESIEYKSYTMPHEGPFVDGQILILTDDNELKWITPL